MSQGDDDMKSVKNYEDFNVNISVAVLHLYDFDGSISFETASEVFRSKNEMKRIIGAIDDKLVDFGDNGIWVKPSLIFGCMEVFA